MKKSFGISSVFDWLKRGGSEGSPGAPKLKATTETSRIEIAVSLAERCERAEQELERYRTRLDDLVAARATALEESHRQIRLSERMAALGTLSAGLGHDMGNLLLPVRLRLESMAIKGIPEHLTEDVQAIARCAEYLQRLSNGLRLLSLDPDRPSAQGVTDLMEWWIDIETFLKNSLPRGVELERHFDVHLPAIGVSRHRLTQAILNLIQNAGDAVRDRPRPWVRVSAFRGIKGGTVRIEVSDNGIGMSPETRTRCLEPFYTSKVRGISTGLGLALVHGIVQQVAGSIEVESEAGRGTTIALTFPIAATPDRSPSASPFGPPVKALVSFAQERLSNYAVSVARAIGADVVQTTSSAMATVDFASEVQPLLWLANSADLDDELMQSFLNGPKSSPRRVIVFGGTPDGRSLAPTIEWIDQPTPSKIRNVLRKTIADMVTESDLASA